LLPVRRAAGETCSSVSTRSTLATRRRCLRSRSPTPRPSPRRPLGACASRASSRSAPALVRAAAVAPGRALSCELRSLRHRRVLEGRERGQSGTGHWMVQATAQVADSSGSVGAGSRKTSTQVRASTSLTRWRSLTSPSSEQRGEPLVAAARGCGGKRERDGVGGKNRDASGPYHGQVQRSWLG
jgi:hypothetical protein